MNPDKIQQSYANKRAAEQKTQQEIADKKKHDQLVLGTDLIQKAIIKSTQLAIEHRDAHEPKVEVKNFPKPLKSISTPDINKVVDQLKVLEKSLSPQNIDFKPVKDALVNLGKKLDSLISAPEKEDVAVNNLENLKPYFDNIAKSIKAIDVSPVVNVKPADVKIKDNPIDLQPVIDSVKELGKCFTDMKMPDNTKQFDALIAAQASLEDTISNLKFPTPNYILPFKESDGSATQVQVDSSGNLPVSVNGSSPVTIQNENQTFKDDFTGTSLDSTAWTVTQSDGSTGYSVSANKLAITAGTTNGAYIALTSTQTFTVPFRVQVIMSASQRNANNNFYIEMVNAAGTQAAALGTTAASTGVTQVAYAFTGATATNGNIVAQNNGVKATADTAATVATTANYSVYELECRGDVVDYATRTTDVAAASSLNSVMRNRTILVPGEQYYLQLRSYNSGVPTATTYNIESVLVQDVTKTVVEISGGRGNTAADKAIPTTVSSGALTSVGTLTTLTNWGNVVDNGAFVDGTTRLSPNGYIYDEVAGTALTENDAAAARIDAKRAQIGVIEDATTRGQRATVSAAGALSVDGSAVTQPISGTVTVGASTMPTTLLAFTTTNATAGVRTQLASNTVTNGVILEAPSTNTGIIYVGGSTVSSTSFGTELQPGQSTSIAIDNTNKIYIDSSVSGDKCAVIGS